MQQGTKPPAPSESGRVSTEKKVLVPAELFEDMTVCVSGSGAIFPIFPEGLTDIIDPQADGFPPAGLVRKVIDARRWKVPSELPGDGLDLVEREARAAIAAVMEWAVGGG